MLDNVCILLSVSAFIVEKLKTRRAVRASSLVDLVAVVMAIVITVRGGPAVEDVEGDIARRGSKHHQVTLAQGRVITTVTEGTLLHSVGMRGENKRAVVSLGPDSLLTRQIAQQSVNLKRPTTQHRRVPHTSSERRKVDTSACVLYTTEHFQIHSNLSNCH